jgi:unsaturated rhamnogalacturonyl hydrolase
MILYLRNIFLISILLWFPIKLLSQDIQKTKEAIRLIVDVVIKEADFQFLDQQNNIQYRSSESIPSNCKPVLKSVYNDWRYWNGVLNISILRIGETLDEKKYSEFAVKNIEFSFKNYEYFQKRYNGENKWNYPFGQLFILEELDDCGAMGAATIEVYRHDKQKIYKEYIDKVAKHILKKQSRMYDGTLVRSFPQKWTIWADDLYMGLSFLSRYAELTGNKHTYNEAANQVINFHKYLFNREKSLMYHCWYSDVKESGLAFWGRANGWVLLAQMDLLERIPKNHLKYKILKNLFTEHIHGIARYQDSTGLWHQLLDKNDSYLETSCSAMFTYVILRAISKNILDHRYISIAKKGWEGILTRINPDGKIEGVCSGTGIGDDLVFYYQRPKPLNDIHGIGAVLLAGLEILKLSK